MVLRVDVLFHRQPGLKDLPFVGLSGGGPHVRDAFLAPRDVIHTLEHLARGGAA